MTIRFTFLLIATMGMLAACGPSDKKTVSAKQPGAGVVTTRWKWTPKTEIGIPKGLIIEQNGLLVQAKFVDLKDGNGFVVDRVISLGKYYPDKKQLIFPPGPMMPEQLDQWLRMDAARIEVSFTPEQEVLKARWLGKGVPGMDTDFVRVKE